MKRKNARDRCWWPKPGRKPAREQKKEDRIQRVNRHIFHMHRGGIGAEEAHIRHEGNPSKRNPLRTVELPERPAHVFRSQATGNVLIRKDVRIVALMHKLKAPHAAVCEAYGDDEREADENRSVTVGHNLRSTLAEQVPRLACLPAFPGYFPAPMANRPHIYKCPNFEGCLIGYRGEDIEVFDGMHAVCPECDSVLQPLPKRTPAYVGRLIDLAVVVAVAAALYYAWPSISALLTAPSPSEK